MSKSVVQVIVEKLIEARVDYIFGVTGKGISTLIDATLDFAEIDYVPAKHESGAALMAYGYAQGSGKIGVCCATTGGGSTNLATGVATAYMNSMPLLVFTGQTATGEFGKGAFQESTGIGQTIDTVAFFDSIAKESIAISDASKIPEIIDHAIEVSTSGRMGPVHLNLPFDIQHKKIEYQRPSRKIEKVQDGIFVDNDTLQAALSRIEASEKPTFLIGWGGVLSGAVPELLEVAEKMNIPVASTLQGKGAVPETHSLYLGYFGLFGHPIVTDYIFEECDLLVAVGTDFDEFTSFNWDDRFLKNKGIIQVDIDARELGKNYPVDLALHGDAADIFRQMKKMVAQNDSVAKDSGDIIMQKIREEGRVINPESLNDPGVPIKPQRVMKEIRARVPDHALFLADSGAHCVWALHYLPVYPGGSFYPNQSLGAMGASICASMGVKLAKPENPVVCVCGDGAFLMSGNEIATAGQLNIPVIWVILNDSRYNLPAFSMKKQFNRTAGVDMNPTDFSVFAGALGVKGYRVAHPEELVGALEEAVSNGQPAVIDVVIDPDEAPPIGARKLN